MDLARVVDLVRARGVPAQLCVRRHGRVVVDEAYGCAPDALFYLFSTSKPYVALLVHLLAQRGLVDLDEPVARYWPEFGQRGKAAATVRQVLQHRAGVPVARSVARDALAARDWTRSVRHLERARPSFPPGRVPAYHILSFGFILGEVARRVTGTPVDVLLRTELLAPLGLADTHLGLADGLWARHVPVVARGAGGPLRAAFFNLRSTRRAVIPAAGVSATARDVARFYQALLDGGAGVLAPSTIAAACSPSSEGERDRLLCLPVRWSQGFQLGGPLAGREAPMGRLSGRATFGHNGSHACMAWADPERDLVFAYVTGLLPPAADGARHLSEVADTLLTACD